ncbi:hypothetical protein [Paramaledivibacter caminithermalis]|jgi:hypothetical protein|uniref:Uncharacterized protein n=1 Tax=Paramaledivibacter caminithermalis (strain DSM 15212 / CIP 107654 / DViRD3) TaxID=1121301 RepID=A0A1M6TFI7_PARC5|nr:hypothetical protein [Paramaledivibacter caminithermalis]SHK55721.1 hypothetical protein SAMN02745912_03670 [Paramaledivibacter caminithermalis DSM 15212]
MLKAINLVAKEGLLDGVTAGCNNCDPKDICTLCDVRDFCSSCDSEWCNPFVKDDK